MILCTISIVNAEKCTLISGNGTDIGSEIDCAGERFYIIESTDENIKMLSKYNLYVGTKYETSTKTYTTSSIYNSSEMKNTCKSEMGDNASYALLSAIEPITYTCYIKTDLEYSEVKQSEEALGAHGGSEGNPDPIEIGVIRLITYDLIADSSEEANTFYNNYTFEDGKLSYLTQYEEYLNTKGINALDSYLITIEEIDNLVYKTSNKRLPLDEWANNDWEALTLPHGGHDSYTDLNYYKVGSIKENMKSGYEWLWQTTYWTGTLNKNNGYVYFIDTLGNICADYPCPTAVGAGIRPVVTLSSSDIDFLIETKTDGHGTVESEKVKAYGGEVIKFTITPNEGYVLGEVKVTDANGNVITFTSNTFTMPNANVLIEATFVLAETQNIDGSEENPKTSPFNSIIPLVAVLSFIIVIIAYIKAKQINKKEV